MVILEIFHRNARSRAAQAQVEIPASGTCTTPARGGEARSAARRQRSSVGDASDPGFERQLEVTDEVLEEIGANVVPASASSTASSSARCDKFRTFDPNTPILY